MWLPFIPFIKKLTIHKITFCRTKMFFSRCLKLFKKQGSHEDQEVGNCCSHAEFAKSKRSLRRVIKLFAYFICTAGFFYHIWSFLQIYLAYPTILDIKEEYPETFTAPAITVCNGIRLLRQEFCKTYPEECEFQHTTWEEFCDANKRMCPESKPPDFNFGIPKSTSLLRRNRSNTLLNSVGRQPASDFISSCTVTRMSQKIGTCSPVFRIQAAKSGFPYKCFTLFSLLGQQNEELLHVSVDDVYYLSFEMHPEEYFNNEELVQASVTLHDPRTLVNPMIGNNFGLTLAAGKIYKLYLTIEKRISLPPPYSSKCMDYLNRWEKNGGYGPLSQKDCADLCETNAMLKRYGCVGLSTTYPNNYPICDERAFVAQPNLNRWCSSQCREACEENIYRLTSETLMDTPTKCDPADEYCKNKNMAILVNFGQTKIRHSQEIPRFESVELFSYIGGYLGMWLGISLASLFDFFEIIYDVMAHLCLKRKKKQKTTTPIKEFQQHTI